MWLRVQRPHPGWQLLSYVFTHSASRGSGRQGSTGRSCLTLRLAWTVVFFACLGCPHVSVMVNLNNHLDSKEHASWSAVIITHYMQALEYLRDSLNSYKQSHQGNKSLDMSMRDYLD